MSRFFALAIDLNHSLTLEIVLETRVFCLPWIGQSENLLKPPLGACHGQCVMLCRVSRCNIIFDFNFYGDVKVEMFSSIYKYQV